MANLKIAVKYTDEVYATHADLQKALKMSLIGDFWKDIVEYRGQYQKKILLKTIGNLPFYYVESPALLARYRAFEDKLNVYRSMYEELLSMPTVKKNVEKSFMLQTLRNVVSLLGIKVSEPSLKALVSGMFDQFGGTQDSNSLLLSRYRDILRDLPSQYNEYSMDQLVKHYSALSGEEELTSFYRESNSPSYRAPNYTTASRVYEEAPFEKIEELMDAMFTFQRIEACKVFVKAIAVGFDFLYLKPFAQYNSLLASLSAKTIFGGCGNAFIPLELAFENTPRWQEISRETQLSGDLTYIILHVIDILSKNLDLMMEAIAYEKKVTVEEEAYHAPAAPQVPVDEPTPILEDVPEVEDVMIEVPLEKEDRLEEVPVVENEIERPYEGKTELALSAKKPTMTEKEIKDAARFLLETHPLLRKQQALFFASHCTIGRYYSIQDYKKFAKCVYETARTSMDNLAREKLYKKLKIKNKYVYTPIRQGE